MGKNTDYKDLWRKQQRDNLDLTVKMNNILNALDPAVSYIKGVLKEEEYNEFMKLMGLDFEEAHAERNN